MQNKRYYYYYHQTKWNVCDTQHNPNTEPCGTPDKDKMKQWCLCSVSYLKYQRLNSLWRHNVLKHNTELWSVDWSEQKRQEVKVADEEEEIKIEATAAERGGVEEEEGGLYKETEQEKWRK